MDDRIKGYNKKIVDRLNTYLDSHSADIDETKIKLFLKNRSKNLNYKHAYMYLLGELMNLDIHGYDMELFEVYFNDMVEPEDISLYTNNAYYRNIKTNRIRTKDFLSRQKSIRSYQTYQRNDFIQLDDRIIPQIGYFCEKLKYPAVMINKSEILTITPYEINTTKKDIDDAFGNVLIYGLGLGYYVYMVSLKDSVKSINIVENDFYKIDLFNRYILSQFKFKDKINIINDDAFNYQKNREDKYDFVYVDIWNNYNEGLPIYKEFKKTEKKDETYRYWLEKTMKFLERK